MFQILPNVKLKPYAEKIRTQKWETKSEREWNEENEPNRIVYGFYTNKSHRTVLFNIIWMFTAKWAQWTTPHPLLLALSHTHFKAKDVFFSLQKLTYPIIDTELVNNASNSIIFDFISLTYSFSSLSYSIDIALWCIFVHHVCVLGDWRTYSFTRNLFSIQLTYSNDKWYPCIYHIKEESSTHNKSYFTICAAVRGHFWRRKQL